MDPPNCRLSALQEMCRERARSHPRTVPGYAPTSHQILFFALLWAAKQGAQIEPASDRIQNIALVDLDTHVTDMIRCLEDGWGEAVVRLQEGDEREWELLRIQLVNAVKRYRSPFAEDAVHDAIVRLWRILANTPRPDDLDATKDIARLVVTRADDFSNLYDFRSSFYAFAKRVAQNRLLDHLASKANTATSHTPVEDLVGLPSTEDVASAVLAYEKRELDRLQLRETLARLLLVIDHRLTPKPALVVTHTLAIRPRFRFALDFAQMAWPADFPHNAQHDSDDAIGAAIGMSANAVRVHRNQARRRIGEFDPILGNLLQVLMEKRE